MKQVLILAALLAVSGCAKTEDHTEHQVGVDTNSSSMHSSHEMSGNMQADMDMMNRKMVENLGQSDSSYDARFIDMMIPHHEGAVMMAQDALNKSTHPEMRKMAEAIIASQQQEIEQMKAWRNQWYGSH